MSLSAPQRSRSRHISRACFQTLEDRRLLNFSPATSFPVGTTPGGDAYTFGELAEMLQQAGFHSIQQHPLDPSNETAVIATKA